MPNHPKNNLPYREDSLYGRRSVNIITIEIARVAPRRTKRIRSGPRPARNADDSETDSGRIRKCMQQRMRTTFKTCLPVLWTNYQQVSAQRGPSGRRAGGGALKNTSEGEREPPQTPRKTNRSQQSSLPAAAKNEEHVPLPPARKRKPQKSPCAISCTKNTKHTIAGTCARKSSLNSHPSRKKTL